MKSRGRGEALLRMRRNCDRVCTAPLDYRLSDRNASTHTGRINTQHQAGSGGSSTAGHAGWAYRTCVCTRAASTQRAGIQDSEKQQTDVRGYLTKHTYRHQETRVGSNSAHAASPPFVLCTQQHEQRQQRRALLTGTTSKQKKWIKQALRGLSSDVPPSYTICDAP